MSKHLKILLLVIASVSVVSSCGKEDKSEWYVTSDGVKLYMQDSLSTLFTKLQFEWIGGEKYGLADGRGTLVAVDKKGEKHYSKVLDARYGLTSPEAVRTVESPGSSAYYGSWKKGKPHGFGLKKEKSTIYIGNFKKGRGEGHVYVIQNGRLFYDGKWKNSRFKGAGKMYYPDGIMYVGNFKKNMYDGEGALYAEDSTLIYKGKWKNGQYDGLGTLNDSTNKYAGTHVWKNGDLPKNIKTVYDVLDDFDQKSTASERINYKARLLVWERYRELLITVGVVLVLALGIAVVTVNMRSYNLWPKRKEPYSLAQIYLYLILGGWFGLHRARLDVTSFWSLLKSQYPLFVMLFFFSLRNIVVCGINIGLWSQMPSWILINVLFWLLIAWLLVDIVWIRFRVYQLTGMYFRKTQDELDILQGKKTEIETFCETTGQRIEKKLQELPDLLEEANNIYSEKSSARLGSLKFEEEKLDKLIKVCSKAEDVVSSVRWYYDRMFAYLRDSRLAAYRNLYLAKELMAVARSVQGKKQELKTDIYHEMDMDITLDASVLEPITFNYGSMINTFSDTAQLFSSLGFKSRTSMAIGAGLAIAEAAISYVSARNEKKMEIVKNQAKVIDALKKISGDLSKIQAEILRSLEILASLYKCNKAFVNAYVPLRDEVFGDATFTNFIRGVRSDNPLFSSEEFIKDVNHLCVVCSEYNKINKAK